MREQKFNIGFSIKLAALIPLLAALSLLCSCHDDGAKKDGITVEPPPSYSYDEQTLDYAEELLYSVLSKLETERGGALSQSEITKLRKSAKEISRIGANGRISEERYLSLVRAFYGEREIIAGVVLGRLPFSAAEQLWRTVISTAGRDFASDILFDLLLYQLEGRRQAALDAYETGGAGYQLALAEKHARSITALKNGIGRENLSKLLDYAFMISELMINPSLDNGAASLTDGEALMLLTYLNPAELTLSAEGWELALTLPADIVLASDEPSFLQKMYFAAAKNGDLEKVAAKMPEMISLICSVQSRLSVDTVALIRAGDGAAVLTDIVSNFSVEDFNRLDSILSIELENTEYSTLARGYYGAPYAEYLASLRTYTKEELIAAKNTDALYDTLKGYIAGRCPALAYAIFYENDQM